MDRSTFNKMRSDILVRCPSLRDIDIKTWRVWYDELFRDLDSGDTMQVFNQWWRNGQGPKTAAEREAFGPQLAAAVSDIEYKRQQRRELNPGRAKSIAETLEGIGCGPAYRKNLELRRRYREENHDATADDVNYYANEVARDKWESLIHDDAQPDLDQPRLCGECKGVGTVTKQVDGKWLGWACTCERGDKHANRGVRRFKSQEFDAESFAEAWRR